MPNTYIFEGIVTSGTGKLVDLCDFSKEKHYIFPEEEHFTSLLSVKFKPSSIHGCYTVDIYESSLKNALYQLQYALDLSRIDFFASRRYICLTDDKKSARMIKDFNKYLIVRRFRNENQS